VEVQSLHAVFGDKLPGFIVKALGMFAIKHGGVDRQGAIHNNGHIRDQTIINCLAEKVGQILRATNRESRHDDLAAAFDRPFDHINELIVSVVHLFMRLVTVGTFHHQRVRPCGQHRIAQNRGVKPADVA